MINDFGYSQVLDQSLYTYSEPIEIRKWPGNGYINVKVGYVKKHPENNCILLEKQWKGKNGYEIDKFNIRDGEDWLSIKKAVDNLWPELKEGITSEDIEKAINKAVSETKLLDLIAKYPELLSKIPEDIDILSLPQEEKEALKKLLQVGGKITNEVIKKLSEQPINDLEDFVRLLGELKLSTINSLITHISSRVNFINMFEKVIHNEGSYERRGKDSIHNLLRFNIWMVDRNFSVLHDDETLRNIILAEWDKEVAKGKDMGKRPDFLCMVDLLSERSNYKKLVIIEIKRPSVKICLDHIDQVMEYRTTLQEHSGKPIDEFTCYLVGKEVDKKLQMNDFSRSGFVIKTYTDFIGEARHFYEEYLKIIQAENLAF